MAKIALFGIIGEGDNTPEAILPQLNGDVTVLIDSPGGEVFAGMGIFNLLKSHTGKVTIEIVGMAGSIASIIALAGDTVKMSETASFFIHNALVPMTGGNAEDLREQADTLEQISNTIRSVYESKTDLTANDIQALMDEETILNSADALQLGFVDEIINPLKAVAKYNHIDMNKLDELKNLANAVAVKLHIKAEADTELVKEVEDEIEETVKEALEDAEETESNLEALTDMVPRAEFAEYQATIAKLLNTILEAIDVVPSEEAMKALVNETTNTKITSVLTAMKGKTEIPSQKNDFKAEVKNENVLSHDFINKFNQNKLN